VHKEKMRYQKSLEKRREHPICVLFGPSQKRGLSEKTISIQGKMRQEQEKIPRNFSLTRKRQNTRKGRHRSFGES